MNADHRVRRWGIRVEIELRDLWVGVYWRRDGHRLDVLICLVPCLPIHLWRWREKMTWVAPR